MKFVSWNVNGLRACMGKGFMDSFKALDADFFCLQETKLQEGQITMDLPGYHQYWCYAEKKGYSGTAIFTRHEPQSVAYGIGIDELDTEGRVITLEYPEFYMVTCYTPNAQRGLARIEHRMKWEEAFRAYLKGLDEKKPVILCGDLNVAHKEIDLKNPSSNRGNAGFSDEERGAFTALLDAGFTDSFRHLYPDVTGAYSWWSYMFNARQNNAGWRIDYFVVSDRLADAIHDATIHPDIMGSDHCPVGLDLNTTCNGGIRIAPPDVQEQQEANDADGSNSVGISRILMTLMVFALLGTLAFTLIPRLKPTSKDEPTSPSMVTIPQMEPVPLIKEIIDRSGNCIWSFNHQEPWSSSLANEYFVCGTEQFLLVPKVDFDMEPISPANFYLQVVFSDSFTFNNEDRPQIRCKNVSYQSFEYTGYHVMNRYYYGDDGNIAGCFLYGYCLRTVDIEVTVKTDTLSCTRNAKIVPYFEFDSMTTAEVVNLIEKSGMILSHLTSSYFPTDDLIEQEPLLQELLKREDAIRTLLDCYLSSLNISISYLLSNQRFQALMTEEEMQEFMMLQKSQVNDEILYGQPIAGWADGPA